MKVVYSHTLHKFALRRCSPHHIANKTDNEYNKTRQCEQQKNKFLTVTTFTTQQALKRYSLNLLRQVQESNADIKLTVTNVNYYLKLLLLLLLLLCSV
jgi:hypothetical protein